MTRMEPETWVVENHGSKVINKKTSTEKKNGIDIIKYVNAKDGRGFSPLHTASFFGATDVGR